jgi:hypothetical protein
MSHTLAVFVCRTLKLSESTYVCKIVRHVSYYSRIPFVRRPWDRTGAGLSNTTSIGLSSYRLCFVTDPIFGLHN